MAEGVDAQNPSGPQASVNHEAKEREGLRINFTIDNRHLIAHTLYRMGEGSFPATEHTDDLVSLQNFARGISEKCSDFVAWRLTEEQFLESGGNLGEVTNFLRQVENSSEFGRVRQQTQEYLESVKSQWERNYPKSSQTVSELTGLNLNKVVSVYVIHPGLMMGQYLGDDAIAWGHPEDWQNYSTVYLWHEILHSYMDYTDLSHALIQLVTDNELRVQLNEGETYPPFEGHENLFPLMNKLLPHWQAYLAEIPEGGKRNLLAFEERLKTMPEFREEKPKEPETKIIE